MNEKKPSLSGLVRELAPEMCRELGPPPTPEELDAYADGDLAEEEADRIREHLTWSRESRKVVLDLVAFPDVEPPPTEAPLSESELRTAWRELQARLDADARPAREPAPATPLAAKVLAWRPQGTFGGSLAALAAIFLTTSLAGLGFWNLSLLQDIEDLSAPRILGDVVGLIPAGIPFRGEVGPRAVTAGSEPLVLSLSLTDTTPYRYYLVEINDPQGHVHWQGGGSRLTSAGTLAVLLPRRDFLPAGDYRILLYVQDDEKKLLGEYELRIEAP
ncbi:MAG: zf-HC2 domain-containing protein [bacterium]|nr:zf-HC2 domain-containing protein [bacterium]